MNFLRLLALPLLLLTALPVQADEARVREIIQSFASASGFENSTAS